MSRTSRTASALLVVAALGLAACGGGDDDGAAGEASATIAAGDLYFEYDGTRSTDADLTVPVGAGEVAITLDNQGSAQHNIVIEELDDQKVAEAQGGGSDSGTVTLEAGSYTFYCDVEGHRGAGMEGTLRVG